MMRMSKMFEIPEKYFAEEIKSPVIQKHMRRVAYFKKIRKRVKNIDYINKFINREIGYNEFLNKQHKKRIKDCAELILFKNPDDFYAAYALLCRNKERENLESVYNHETLHYGRCKEYGIDSYFGIKFTDLERRGGDWHFQMQASLVGLFEKKALGSKWPLKKYLAALEDCATVSSLSSGDRGTLKTIKEIKKSYKI